MEKLKKDNGNNNNGERCNIKKHKNNSDDLSKFENVKTADIDSDINKEDIIIGVPSVQIYSSEIQKDVTQIIQYELKKNLDPNLVNKLKSIKKKQDNLSNSSNYIEQNKNNDEVFDLQNNLALIESNLLNKIQHGKLLCVIKATKLSIIATSKEKLVQNTGQLASYYIRPKSQQIMRYK
jgi:hypothetical protein